MAGVPDLSLEDQRAARILLLWCFVIEETATWSVPAVLRSTKLPKAMSGRHAIRCGRNAAPRVIERFRVCCPDCGLKIVKVTSAAEHVMHSSPDSCSETKKMLHSER
jgi:hypothetical protein